VKCASVLRGGATGELAARWMGETSQERVAEGGRMNPEEALITAPGIRANACLR